MFQRDWPTMDKSRGGDYSVTLVTDTTDVARYIHSSMCVVFWYLALEGPVHEKKLSSRCDSIKKLSEFGYSLSKACSNTLVANFNSTLKTFLKVQYYFQIKKAKNNSSKAIS